MQKKYGKYMRHPSMFWDNPIGLYLHLDWIGLDYDFCPLGSSRCPRNVNSLCHPERYHSHSECPQLNYSVSSPLAVSDREPVAFSKLDSLWLSVLDWIPFLPVVLTVLTTFLCWKINQNTHLSKMHKPKLISRINQKIAWRTNWLVCQGCVLHQTDSSDFRNQGTIVRI